MTRSEQMLLKKMAPIDLPDSVATNLRFVKKKKKPQKTKYKKQKQYLQRAIKQGVSGYINKKGRKHTE